MMATCCLAGAFPPPECPPWLQAANNHQLTLSSIESLKDIASTAGLSGTPCIAVITHPPLSPPAHATLIPGTPEACRRPSVLVECLNILWISLVVAACIIFSLAKTHQVSWSSIIHVVVRPLLVYGVYRPDPKSRAHTPSHLDPKSSAHTPSHLVLFLQAAREGEVFCVDFMQCRRVRIRLLLRLSSHRRASCAENG